MIFILNLINDISAVVFGLEFVTCRRAGLEK